MALDVFEGLGQGDEGVTQSGRWRRACRPKNAHQVLRRMPERVEAWRPELFPELSQTQPGIVKIPVERGSIDSRDASPEALGQQGSCRVGIHGGLPVEKGLRF
jgi:hypothetical protein